MGDKKDLIKQLTQFGDTYTKSLELCKIKIKTDQIPSRLKSLITRLTRVETVLKEIEKIWHSVPENCWALYDSTDRMPEHRRLMTAITRVRRIYFAHIYKDSERSEKDEIQSQDQGANESSSGTE